MSSAEVDKSLSLNFVREILQYSVYYDVHCVTQLSNIILLLIDYNSHNGAGKQP